MQASVTAFYASLAALLLLGLCYNVVRFRQKGGTEAEISHAMRVQGNASEYIPIMLLLLLIFEINGGSVVLTHLFGISMMVSRGLHAWGFGRSSGASFGRFYGTALTWLTLLLMILANLVSLVL